MLRNNLTAFGLHLVIVILSSIVFLLSALTEIGGTASQFIFFVLSVAIYLVIGSKSKDMGSVISNFLSFSSIWIVGLIIWSTDFKVYDMVEFNDIKMFEGIGYYIYLSSLGPILDLCNVPINEKFSALSPIRAVWVTFIPSILMFVGIEWRIHKNKVLGIFNKEKKSSII